MCQKTLQLSHKLLTLLTTTQESNQIVSLECTKIISLTSATASTTPLKDLPSPPPLLLLLDVPGPDLKSLFWCRLARVHQEDRSSFTCKSTSPLKIRLTKCTFDFHSEVTSPLKNVLASALLTFTHKSPRCGLHAIREGSPL